MIILADNKKVEISNVDKERVLKHRWHIDKQTGYAYTYIKSKKTYLHRFVTNCTNSLVVDHINRNIYDNRRENLRIVTYKINSRNQSILANNETKFKNIYLCKTNKKYKYMFQTRLDGKTTTIARSNSIIELLNIKAKFWLENFGLDIRKEIIKATMQYFNLDNDMQDLILETDLFARWYKNINDIKILCEEEKEVD